MMTNMYRTPVMLKRHLQPSNTTWCCTAWRLQRPTTVKLPVTGKLPVLLRSYLLLETNLLASLLCGFRFFPPLVVTVILLYTRDKCCSFSWSCRSCFRWWSANGDVPASQCAVFYYLIVCEIIRNICGSIWYNFKVLIFPEISQIWMRRARQSSLWKCIRYILLIRQNHHPTYQALLEKAFSSFISPKIVPYHRNSINDFICNVSVKTMTGHHSARSHDLH